MIKNYIKNHNDQIEYSSTITLSLLVIFTSCKIFQMRSSSILFILSTYFLTERIHLDIIYDCFACARTKIRLLDWPKTTLVKSLTIPSSLNKRNDGDSPWWNKKRGGEGAGGGESIAFSRRHVGRETFSKGVSLINGPPPLLLRLYFQLRLFNV